MTKGKDFVETIIALQTKLKEREEQFQNIIERSIDGILIVDDIGTVRFVNPAACQILGREKREILGETFGFPLISNSSTQIDILQRGEKRIAEMRVVDTSWENEQAFLLSLRDITLKKKGERLRREALERAQKIQSSLFPTTLPPIPEMELGGQYRQAEHIGGDFYNITPIEDGILLLMADVTGHGLDAALITIFLSTFLRQKLEIGDNITRPLKLLKNLQQDFFNQGFPDDYSLEVFLAFISQKTLDMSYAAAGNIRAYLFEEDGTLTKLPSSHGALINNTITYPLFGSHTFTLSPQQTLLIYTDGVDEPFLFKDPELGQRFLQETLKKTFGLLSVGEMLERILGDVIVTTEEQLQDDMAILAILPKKKMIGEKSWSCPPHTPSLYSILHSIREEIKNLPVDGDMVWMAIQEAISNAMVHTPKDTMIEIKAFWNKKELIISVKDEGPGFNWRQTLHKRIQLLDSKERGRGLSLIEMATTSFTLNNRGNKIVMSWTLGSSPISKVSQC